MSAEKFNEVEPLVLEGFRTEFITQELLALIDPRWPHDDVRLFVNEARALRDWLNKAIPEEGK